MGHRGTGACGTGGSYRDGVMPVLRWSSRARRELNAVLAHIVQEDAERAAAVYARVDQATAHLSNHPAMGRPGRIPGTRELVNPRAPFAIPNEGGRFLIPARYGLLQPGDDLRAAVRMLPAQRAADDDALHGFGHIEPRPAQGGV